MKPAALPVRLRVVLYDREVLRLPFGSQGLRVRSGRAWLTLAGKDVILPSGETLRLAPRQETAIVSALGKAPLVLEILGDDRLRPAALWPAALSLSLSH
jgi:hypothetical protein